MRELAHQIAMIASSMPADGENHSASSKRIDSRRAVGVKQLAAARERLLLTFSHVLCTCIRTIQYTFSISSHLQFLRSSIVERPKHLVLSVFCFQFLSVDSPDESQRH